MPGKLVNNSDKIYLQIVGGNVVQKVSKDTPGAKLRAYELPNGTKGEKYELIYQCWEGNILGITFKETDYGEMCLVEFKDAILSINTASRYFTDFACKLFSSDIKKPFIIHPYDMETESGKKRGVSLQQDGVKLKNYFYDGEKNINGFPEVDKVKSEKKSYWKIYFAEVTEFLIEKIKELNFEKIEEAIQGDKGNTNIEDLAEETFKNDLPF